MIELTNPTQGTIFPVASKCIRGTHATNNEEEIKFGANEGVLPKETYNLKVCEKNHPDEWSEERTIKTPGNDGFSSLFLFNPIIKSLHI